MAVPVRPSTRLGVTLLAASAAVLGLQHPAAAGPPNLDPAALPRGDNPGVVHLVRDTIRDGALRVPATERGRHDALWVVAGGYLLRDYNVGKHNAIRVVYVDGDGDRRVVARSRQWIDVEVSPSGQRIVHARSLGESLRSRFTVTDAATGDVLAQRDLRLATLAATTEHRVLIARRLRWRDPATVWWNHRRDSLRRLNDQAALDADVRHNKVVFHRPGTEHCIRVAPLQRPARTLWRSCQQEPHQWSPDGSRTVSTHTYFDAAGTDRWWVTDGRTGERQARITGRLDWDAVWEDNQHFLTKAQSDAGKAAVIRCDVDGACERASRIWNVPLPSEESLYYASPPVVLADR